MEKRWTQNQSLAITYHGSDTLVAAAAGSGKTAVLTERVIRMLTKEEDALDISRLLIVTFTKAAAEELVTRIKDRLEKMLKEEPSEHLRRQLEQLPNAKISTIHSFCYSLIKDNFSTLGLPAGVRIADDIENELLMNEQMEQLLDDCYDGAVKIPSFDIMCDNFLRSKTDENLCNTFIAIYKETMNSPRGLALVKESAERCRQVVDGGFEGSVYFEKICKKLRSFSTYYLGEYKRLIDKYSDEEQFNEKYYPALLSDMELMRNVLVTLEAENYKKCISLIKDEKDAKLSSAKGECDFKEETKKLRGAFKNSKKEIVAFFGYGDEELKHGAEKSAEIFDVLYAFLTVYDERLKKKKRERKILDFNDLEHLACRLLWDAQKGERTELAREVSEGIDEILIDEYQDTNELQDLIFSSIAHSNRFMVGDIKQSVYGFRGAEPEIFASYRKSFSNSNKGKTIFLSNNFRCAECVIDFTNEVFSSLFSDNDSVPYTADDALVFSKTENEASGECGVEIALINSSEDYVASEAYWVAEKISYLLKHGRDENGNRYKPSDFAILMRSTKSVSKLYENELNARGIPVNNSSETGFFDNPEIELVICILNAVDNPLNDIYLAGAMKSPIFGFSLDELVEIRTSSEKGSLYEAVMERADADDEKCKAFIAALSEYRRNERAMPAHRFIDLIYRKTGLRALLYAPSEMSGVSAEAKDANLTLLYEMAKTYERGSFKGVYSFIRYINNIIEKGKTLGSAKTDGGDGGVRILTIHKSKGLEFPVCFLCECGRKLNVPRQGNYNYSTDYLFGIKVKSEDGFLINKYPMYSVINDDNKDKDFYESGRVLYVAFTRARQRLFITAQLDDAEKLLGEYYTPHPKSGYGLRGMQSSVSLILSCLNSERKDKPYKISVINNVFDERIGEGMTTHNDKTVIDPEPFIGLFKERFDFVYPFEHIAKMPKKVAVSHLYPDFLDDDEASAKTDDVEVPFIFPMYDTNENKSAERGVATHVFMQFCNMKKACESVTEECHRLINEGYMPREYEKLIYVSEIERFFESDLYRYISATPYMLREYRFNVGLPASEFSFENKEALSSELLFVQGVIDCAFENENGELTIVDYKTDRLKNTEADIAAFIARHSTQLQYYKVALERITKRKVTSLLLYSFCLGKAVNVDFDR